MNGRIGVQSTPGEGSTFWIECALADSTANKIAGMTMVKAEPRFSNQHNRNFTVLYIEDNPANLRLVQGIFKMRPNIRLISAYDAESGLHLARTEQPDLVILDINLPKMNGYQALTELQNDNKQRTIPIVALSASAMPSDIHRGLNAGFKHYFTKPLQVADFLNTIDYELNTLAR